MRGGARTQRGFTLVEVLIAASLLSVVMLALGAGLRSAVDTEERVDRRLARADTMRSTADLLRGALGRVSTRRVQAVGASGQSQFYFSGGPTEVVWVGVLPGSFGRGGRYFFRLALEPQPGSRPRLVLRMIPWQAQAAIPGWAVAESRVLADSVERFALDYEDDQAPSAAWTPAWTVANRLPTRIRIQVAADGMVWPPVTVPMRQVGPSAGGGGAVLGGSS